MQRKGDTGQGARETLSRRDLIRRMGAGAEFGGESTVGQGHLKRDRATRRHPLPEELMRAGAPEARDALVEHPAQVEAGSRRSRYPKPWPPPRIAARTPRPELAAPPASAAGRHGPTGASQERAAGPVVGSDTHVTPSRVGARRGWRRARPGRRRGRRRPCGRRSRRPRSPRRTGRPMRWRWAGTGCRGASGRRPRSAPPRGPGARAVPTCRPTRTYRRCGPSRRRSRPPAACRRRAAPGSRPCPCRACAHG